MSGGAILGNGTTLTTGAPPVFEYVPADTGGTTTNAISRMGRRSSLRAPPRARAKRWRLYMREDDSRTVEIAGSAQYEGASADGSLVFFTSSEGLGGASSDKQLYEFNTTGGQIGDAPAMSAIPISDGLGGDTTETKLTADLGAEETTVTVESTAGFLAGETIEFSGERGQTPGGIREVIASVQDGTHLYCAKAQRSTEGPHDFW